MSVLLPLVRLDIPPVSSPLLALACRFIPANLMPSSSQKHAFSGKVRWEVCRFLGGGLNNRVGLGCSHQQIKYHRMHVILSEFLEIFHKIQKYVDLTVLFL